MPMPTLQQLIEFGAHFGHVKKRSHPRARRFVWQVRDGVMIINVEETVQALRQAIDYLKEVLADGKTILFVGTKRQAKAAVEQLAKSLQQPYLVYHWPAGMLTNFETVRARTKQIAILEQQLNEPNVERTKRERGELQKKLDRLRQLFGGIETLQKLPEVVFIVDPHLEETSLQEARRLAIPVVALTDTDCDPQLIDYSIPVNDDSERAVKLILETIGKELGSNKNE
jgi:small subunit ribosomal protein S2